MKIGNLLEELVHVIVELEKSHNTPSTNWILSKINSAAELSQKPSDSEILVVQPPV